MTDDKTLATFRLDAQLWEAFKAEAAKNGTNASAVLTAYCREYVCGVSRQLSSTSIDEKTKATNIDNLDVYIDKRVQDAVAELTQKMQQQQQQIERLEAQLAGEPVA